jgi:AraC-like DNA-binding protein
VPLKAALENYIAARGNEDGIYSTPIEGLSFTKTSRTLRRYHIDYKPAFCVVVQGAKQVSFDAGTFEYARMQSLIVGAGLPAFAMVTKATAEEPYLGLTLEFDAALLRSVIERLDPPPTPATGDRRGMFVDDVTAPIAECLTRLIRTVETPRAIPVLYPSIMNEIAYWLLTGPNAGRFCQMVLSNGQMRRIADAIYLLRKDLKCSIRIADLATAARMSESSFHQYFKLLTSMTPIQYQKQLRLLEARRLLEVGDDNVTSAAYRVGYQSPSQFSREYKRMFGMSPKRGAMFQEA